MAPPLAAQGFMEVFHFDASEIIEVVEESRPTFEERVEELMLLELSNS